MGSKLPYKKLLVNVAGTVAREGGRLPPSCRRPLLSSAAAIPTSLGDRQPNIPLYIGYPPQGHTPNQFFRRAASATVDFEDRAPDRSHKRQAPEVRRPPSRAQLCRLPMEPCVLPPQLLPRGRSQPAHSCGPIRSNSVGSDIRASVSEAAAGPPPDTARQTETPPKGAGFRQAGCILRSVFEAFTQTRLLAVRFVAHVARRRGARQRAGEALRRASADPKKSSETLAQVAGPHAKSSTCRQSSPLASKLLLLRSPDPALGTVNRLRQPASPRRRRPTTRPGVAQRSLGCETDRRTHTPKGCHTGCRARRIQMP